MSKRFDVILTDGRPATCLYDFDDQGFILFGLHNASGEILEISEAEYDHIEAKATIAAAGGE